MDVNKPASNEATKAALSSAEGRPSYKFQRLREKLRTAIESGEFSGKLPGERQLARRFHVNAKTLSKALTDLAAEGVVQRIIGRGTFVSGRAVPTDDGSAASDSGDRWLIVCDERQAGSSVVRMLCELYPAIHIVHDINSLRPSFLNGFKAVIEMSHTMLSSTRAALLRDLLVRNMSVVLVGREPSTYSVHAVVIDRALGVNLLARDLMLAGHRRFIAVERRGSTQVCDAIRSAAQRYAPKAMVDLAFATEAVGGIELGATAVICDSAESATEVRHAMASAQIEIPGRASLAVVDFLEGEPPCTGYFVHARQKAEAIVQQLREGNARRPRTVWLTGALIDLGTTGPTDAMIESATRPGDGITAA